MAPTISITIKIITIPENIHRRLCTFSLNSIKMDNNIKISLFRNNAVTGDFSQETIAYIRSYTTVWKHPNFYKLHIMWYEHLKH